MLALPGQDTPGFDGRTVGSLAGSKNPLICRALFPSLSLLLAFLFLPLSPDTEVRTPGHGNVEVERKSLAESPLLHSASTYLPRFISAILYNGRKLHFDQGAIVMRNAKAMDTSLPICFLGSRSRGRREAPILRFQSSTYFRDWVQCCLSALR
ncbi:hypothetical protein GALMADRAFT_697684 [Galerina marginata CBS 339.88]|uniref:Uncharacterized protein n=1 Tax=Galerina marginata (strain CBS 339.88) TaxID=685588 RepID=A0A067TP43_GALM3|nr:hypothetical protein GALMADRAFT_697684 [Galerina marginata CBS 339.88]